MNARRIIGVAVLVIVGSPLSASALNVTPNSIVLKRKVRTTELTIGGLRGDGPVRVRVNVGAVETIEERDGAVILRYRHPKRRFPQFLALLLWREGDVGVHVLRLPMLGRARIPVRTRAHSKVMLKIGDKTFGPYRTRRRGRVRASIVVPPGIEFAEVEVTDRAKLKTAKRIAIERPPYPQLVMAVQPPTSAARRPRFTVTIGAAEKTVALPVVEIRDTDGQTATVLRVSSLGKNQWSATWAPATRPDAGRFIVRAALPGDATAALVSVDVLPLKTRSKSVQHRPPGPRSMPSRMRMTLGLGVGMVHNLGALVSPRFGAELGVELALPVGALGTFASFGLGWSGQRVASPSPGLAAADASVLLLPVALGLSYRLRFGRVLPYVAAAFVLQVVRTKSSADYAVEVVRHDLALGAQGMLGAGIRLGPGRIYGQAGFQYGRVDVPDVKLLAGGLLLELGYRFEI